jgi:hypothetical protein
VTLIRQFYSSCVTSHLHGFLENLRTKLIFIAGPHSRDKCISGLSVKTCAGQGTESNSNIYISSVHSLVCSGTPSELYQYSVNQPKVDEGHPVYSQLPVYYSERNCPPHWLHGGGALLRNTSTTVVAMRHSVVACCQRFYVAINYYRVRVDSNSASSSVGSCLTFWSTQDSNFQATTFGQKVISGHKSQSSLDTSTY